MMKKRRKRSFSVPKAGIKTKQLDYWNWNNKILLSSLKKIDISIVLIAVLDIAFYFFVYYIFIFWLQRIQLKMASFNLPSDISTLGFEKTQQLVSNAKLFLYILVLSFILVLLAIIFIASIINSLIWARTTGTRIKFTMISKFFGLNLAWMGFWFIIIFLIAWLGQPAYVPVFMTIILIVSYYLTNTLYAIFMKTQKFKSVFNAINLGITKISLFALPYAAIFLGFFIIFSLSSLFAFKYSSFLFGLLLALYAAVVRYYASTLALEIQNSL